MYVYLESSCIASCISKKSKVGEEISCGGCSGRNRQLRPGEAVCCRVSDVSNQSLALRDGAACYRGQLPGAGDVSSACVQLRLRSTTGCATRSLRNVDEDYVGIKPGL